MAETELASLPATDAAAEIAGGKVSALQYAEACLARIDAVEETVRAFVHFDREHVLAQARALDERRAGGQPLGPLHGMLVGVKDIFDTADYPTENGSKLFAGRRPWHDATVVAKLRVAGAVILKTVTTECAYFHPGPTRNPHDPGAHARRLVVGIGCRGRRRHGAACARQPNQWVGHPPGRVLRRDRREAEPWNDLARRRAAAFAHASTMSACSRAIWPTPRCSST